MKYFVLRVLQVLYIMQGRQKLQILQVLYSTYQEGDGVDDETGQELRPVLPGSVSHLDIGYGESCRSHLGSGYRGV